LFRYKNLKAKIGKDSDEFDWPENISTLLVNAVYIPDSNRIVIPIALITSPFLTTNDANNYGGVGVMMGHELAHAFDPSRKWIASKEDAAAYNSRVQKMETLYANRGFNTNESTIREIFADNVGLAMAFQAFKDKLAKDEEKKTAEDNMSLYQQFYLSYASTLVREEELDDGLTHPSDNLRVNITSGNQPEYDSIFGVTKDNKMYIDPVKRATFW
jgi:putative endopeptidase